MSIASAILSRLDAAPAAGKFRAMADRTVQLVLHYDGAQFAGLHAQLTGRSFRQAQW